MNPVDMPTTFFTAERLTDFWNYVKWFMSFNMPIFMICLAAMVAGLVLDMILDTVQTAKDEQDKKDDDDIDVKYY
jgi:bacteriorhodopsin